MTDEDLVGLRQSFMDMIDLLNERSNHQTERLNIQQGSIGSVAQTDWWDSCRESSVVAGAHEQTHTTELQDQEMAGLQRRAEEARLPDDLVRSGDGLECGSAWKKDPVSG